MLTMTSLGDSQTDLLAGYGVGPADTWTPSVAAILGSQWQARAFGISGQTTTQMLARADVIHMHETPDIFALAGGVNDAGASITTATTTRNVQALLMAAKHGAKGRAAGVSAGISVANPAALPDAQTGRVGSRLVVLDDNSTTGGVDAATPGQAAKIAGSVTADANGNRVTVWECRYPLAGEAGWGRVANRQTAPTQVKRSVVIPPPYRNFTTGGDTPSTPDATNAACRAALVAAVSVEAVGLPGGEPSVIYSDLYAFLRTRITTGADPDFSSVAYDQTRSWHYTQNNQHYSAYGHTLQAVKVGADAKAAWPSLFA